MFDFKREGHSETTLRSARFCYNVKAGRNEFILKLLSHYLPLVEKEHKQIRLFLNKEVSLIPIPRNSPLRSDDVWPSFLISRILLKLGFAKEVFPILSRQYKVGGLIKKSNAEDRPSVEEHYKSFEIEKTLEISEHITLVDDVVTQGRTSYASYLKIKENYPNSQIRLFSMFRTQSFIPEIKSIFNPDFNVIPFNPNTGKTWTIKTG